MWTSTRAIRESKILQAFSIAAAFLLLALLPVEQVIVSMSDSNGASPGSVVLTDGFVRVIIDEPGEDGAGVFTIDTGPDHPLPGVDILYGGGSNATSTYITVRVENTSTDYVASRYTNLILPSSGYTLETLEGYLASQSLGPNYYALTFNLPEGLIVVQNVSIQNVTVVGGRFSSGVFVNVTVYNPTPDPYDVKVRMVLDLKIAEETRPWVAVNDSDQLTNNRFVIFDPGPAVVFAKDRRPDFTIIAKIALGPKNNPPDRIIYDKQLQLVGCSFLPCRITIPPPLPPLPSPEPEDFAIAFYWETSIIPPGGSLTATTIIIPLPPPAVGGKLELTGLGNYEDYGLTVYAALALAVIAVLATLSYRRHTK